MNPPLVWNEVSVNLAFDVNMDFTRKLKWVIDGHKYAGPIVLTYEVVVSI